MNQQITPVELTLVESPHEIRHNLRVFNRDATKYLHRSQNLMRQTTYWLKDTDSSMFAPSKFIGFQSMNFDDYETATQQNFTGVDFNGHLTRRCIEDLIGLKYVEDLDLHEGLITWGEALLGVGVFNDLNQSKWRFIILP